MDRLDWELGKEVEAKEGAGESGVDGVWGEGRGRRGEGRREVRRGEGGGEGGVPAVPPMSGIGFLTH